MLWETTKSRKSIRSQLHHFPRVSKNQTLCKLPFLHFHNVGEGGLSRHDIAFWEDGGHFNGRRPPEVEVEGVRA